MNRNITNYYFAMPTYGCIIVSPTSTFTLIVYSKQKILKLDYALAIFFI
jgi:hypothetical protein